jgi:hypothetical protein
LTAPRGSDGPVTISKITVRDQYGDCIRFQSGQKAWIDVEVTARVPCSKLSVTLYITDQWLTEIFETSTDRLGHGTFDLDEGDVYSCTFETTLNLAGGTFHPSVVIYRYDIQTVYDTWEPATTIYVGADKGVRGTVHCFPQVIRQEVRKASREERSVTASEAAGNKN